MGLRWPQLSRGTVGHQLGGPPGRGFLLSQRRQKDFPAERESSVLGVFRVCGMCPLRSRYPQRFPGATVGCHSWAWVRVLPVPLGRLAVLGLLCWGERGVEGTWAQEVKVSGWGAGCPGEKDQVAAVCL